MPQNIYIAIFILGAVLLLIAFAIEFKIFTAEIHGIVRNPYLRFSAFVLGVILIIVSITLSSKTQAPETPPQTQAPETPPQTQVPETPSTNPESINLTGFWDNGSAVFRVFQEGNNITMKDASGQKIYSQGLIEQPKDPNTCSANYRMTVRSPEYELFDQIFGGFGYSLATEYCILKNNNNFMQGIDGMGYFQKYSALN